ncbi:MAG TPA: hypothetical protein VH442_03955 [Micromonosporaceae bacterium]
MLWKKYVGAAAIASAMIAAGCASGSGSAGSSGTAQGAGSGTTVTVHNVPGVGTTLVDGSGKTLYFADQETSGTIKCLNACLRFWSPLTVSSGVAPTASAGVGGTLSTVHRPDGPMQVTLDGKPLYRFSLDNGPGQTSGNGVTDMFDGTQFNWHAAVASGSAAPASSGGNGYGY